MKVFDFPFPIEIGSVCDLDFLPNGTPVSLQGSEGHQVLMWGEQRLALPEGWTSPEFPIVRLLADGRALVVDTSHKLGSKKNAWILNSKGKVAGHFELGSAMVEVTGLAGLIAVAFHPISAKAAGHQVQPLQRAGIGFFDLQGRLVMGFNQEAAKVGVTVENIRCMTPVSRTQVVFVPERCLVKDKELENPVVLFDCANRRLRLFSVAFPRTEAIALTDVRTSQSRSGRSGRSVYLHLASPESWEDQIITFDAEKKISQHRGEFLGIFRGLEGGAFLAQLSAADYAVISPGEPDNAATVSELAGQEEVLPL